MNNLMTGIPDLQVINYNINNFQWGNETLENDRLLKLINSKEKYSKMCNNMEMIWEKVAEELDIGADAETCKKQYYKLWNRYKEIKNLPIDNESKENEFELYHFFEVVFPIQSQEELSTDFEYIYANFGELCRFCLQKKSEKLMIREIYDDSNEEALTISNHLMHKLQFTLNDNEMNFKLSNLICIPCSDKLDYCFEFKKQCENSSNVLTKVKNEIDIRAQIKPEMLEISVEEKHEDRILLSRSIDAIEMENENLAQNFADHDLPFESSDSLSEASEEKAMTVTPSKTKKTKIKDGVKKPKTKKQYKGKMHQCSICGILCKGIAMHMLTHSGEKKYKCSYCPKSFIQSGQLKRHINSHLNIRNYKCPINDCGKTFVDPSSVTKHLVVHNKDNRKYHCGLCAARFNRLGALRYHEKTHRQERLHSCDVCEKAFLAKYDLTKHYRTHTGEKPYKCDWCSKRFTISKNAKVHMRTHTKEKPYQCPMCEQAFSYRSSLKNHLVKIHNQTEVPALPLLNAINVEMRETTSINMNTVDLRSAPHEIHQQTNVHLSNNSNNIELIENMPMTSTLHGSPLMHYSTEILPNNVSMNQ